MIVFPTMRTLSELCFVCVHPHHFLLPMPTIQWWFVYILCLCCWCMLPLDWTHPFGNNNIYDCLPISSGMGKCARFSEQHDQGEKIPCFRLLPAHAWLISSWAWFDRRWTFRDVNCRSTIALCFSLTRKDKVEWKVHKQVTNSSIDVKTRT